MPEKARNKIGLWTSTSLVVGNMIGAGVFLMPAAMAKYGSISLLGWIFAGIGTFFMARVFASLSKLIPMGTGGPYAYTRYGFGDFAGFIVAWGYYISIVTANAAIAIAFVSALSTFFPVLATNPGAPAINAVAAVSTGLGAIWLLTWINTRGIITTGKVQLITAILKLLPLVVIAAGGLFFIRFENFRPFNGGGGSVYDAINATAAMAMFSFVGIECATIPADNVSNPDQTIPRATMLGLFISALVYILGSVSIMGMIPMNVLQRSGTPYADAAAIMFGPSARYWASGGAAIAAFGALNGWIMVQGKLPFAIAKDRLFPSFFGRQNKKGAPYAGIIFNSALVSLFMLMNYTGGLVEQFRFLTLLAITCMLVPYLFCAAAYLIARFEKKQFHSGELLAAIVVGSLAFAYSLWAIAGSGQSSVYWGFLLLLAGIPFYIGVVYKRNAENAG
jgi:APA family basic amino acid/polyamine antiporter